MMTDKAWKLLGFCLICGGAAILSAANVQAAKPDASFHPGSSVAGMGAVMERHLQSVEESGSQTVQANLTQDKVMYGTFQDIFDNLGVAMVGDSLNIRNEPMNDSDIIGRLGRHGGCSVLGFYRGWYHVRSGQVTGYVSARFLAVGQAARTTAFYDMTLRLRVNTKTLRVRSGPGMEEAILGRLHLGDTCLVLSKAGDGWIKIQYGDTPGYAYAPGNAMVAYTIPEAEKIEGSLGRRVASYAVGFVGKPYVWGGTNPNMGADCSGFVQYVMEHAAGIHLNRTSRQQAAEGHKIPSADMEPGDLLFYASKSSIDHVAMYIGKGKIVHAANRRSGIKISSWNYRNPVSIRRVIP